MSTPVLKNQRLIIGTGDNGMVAGSEQTFAYANLFEKREPFWGREGGDHVIAIDPSSGKQRWSFHTAGEDMPSPVIVGDDVIFANGDARAYGLKLATGEIQWQTALSGIVTMASATEARGTTIISTCGAGLKGETHALGRGGSTLWSSPFGDCDAAPTVGDNRLFVSGVRTNRLKSGYGGSPIVAALDPRTGKALWKYAPSEVGYFIKIGSSERAIAGLYHGGAFIVSLPTLNQLVSFDSRSGAVRWIMHSMAPIKMSAVALRKHLYIGDTAGILYQINEQTGEVAATRMFAGPFTTSPPVIVNETLFIVNATSVNAIPLGSFSRKQDVLAE